MASKEKKLLQNTLLFSVGNAGAKLMMLVIVPLYTYYVSVEQMGQYDLIHIYANLFSPIACVALHEGLYRWLLDGNSIKENVLKSGVIYALVAIVIFDALVIAVWKIVEFPFLIEFILMVDSSCLYTISQFVTRGLCNYKIYAVQGIVYSVLLIIATVVLVICIGLQARGLMLSVVIAAFGTSVFLISVQKLWGNYIVKGHIDKTLSKDLVKYSLPIVPNTVAWWMVSSSNRAIINWGIGVAANGIFAIAMKFPSLVAMLTTFFYQAWQEQAITEYDSKERDIYYSKIFNLYMKLLLSGIIVLLPVTKIIVIHFMDPSYEDAYKYVGILYIASVLNAFAAFYGTGYLSTKKTAGAFSTTIYGAITNVIVTFVLIKYIGLYAAALGNMLGNGAIWIARMIQTKKYFHIEIKKIQMILLLGACVISIVLVNYAGSILLVIYQFVFGIGFAFVNREMVSKAMRIKRK